MFTLGSSLIYQLYSKPCDMRKSFSGLSGIVTQELGRNPLSGEVFIFINRPRDCMKLLHWENGGFVLYYKRLEQGTFTPPILYEGKQSITWPELVMMVEGIAVKKYIQKRRFKIEK